MLHVVEIKSLTKAYKERRLRLGLGQVLRYRDLAGADARASPVQANRAG